MKSGQDLLYYSVRFPYCHIQLYSFPTILFRNLFAYNFFMDGHLTYMVLNQMLLCMQYFQITHLTCSDIFCSIRTLLRLPKSHICDWILGNCFKLRIRSTEMSGFKDLKPLLQLDKESKHVYEIYTRNAPFKLLPVLVAAF